MTVGGVLGCATVIVGAFTVVALAPVAGAFVAGVAIVGGAVVGGSAALKIAEKINRKK